MNADRPSPRYQLGRSDFIGTYIECVLQAYELGMQRYTVTLLKGE